MASEPTTPQTTSKSSLGALVADYRPPRRRDLALELIVVGVMAVVTWWSVVRLDRKLWIFNPFLVALTSTIYGMQLIFRWLSLGDRVAIYDGSVTPLLLDDLDIPTHVDIDRLLQSLRDAPFELEIAHEPKLRTDVEEMSRSQRNTTLAAQLQTALSTLLAEKRLVDDMLPYFADALRDGHRVRGRIARKARWKSVGYALLVPPGIVLLVVAVITGLVALLTTVLCGIQGMSGLIGITLDIIDTNDFPIEFMTFAIAGVLMLGAAAIANWLSPFVEKCYKKAQYHDSLATGLNRLNG